MNSILNRFEAKYFIAPDGCWLWASALTKTGYARAMVNGKMQYVHRVMYSEIIGDIPEGLVIDHLCRNRSCVNPYHLEPVTLAENTRRGDKTKKLCKHGVGFSNCKDVCGKEYHNSKMRRLYKKWKVEKGN